MDKANLESFVAICETGSFSRAALKLHLTQPAISKRLAGLEQQLDTQLIDRVGKKATPTHSGEVLLQHAKKLLLAMEECKVAIRNLETQVSGTLDLGISHHIGLHRLPLTLRTFARTYPHVRLNLSFVESQDAYAQVLSGELELAMATLTEDEDKEHNGKIQTETIWRDPLCFMVSGDHSLARLNNERLLTLDDLAPHTILLPKANNATHTLIRKCLGSHKTAFSIEANSLESLRMMAGIGLGYAILPRTLLNSSLRGLSVDITAPERKLGILHHKSRTLSNAARAFLQILKNCNP